VRFAATAAGLSGTFLVLNGDVLTSLDVSALVAMHRRRGAMATISLTPVDDPSAYGVVPTDAAGRVTAFIEKPRRADAPTNLINAGTYVLEASVVERIPGGRRVSIERETFPELVAEGTLYALASDAYWIDTGTPSTYLQANLDVLAQDGQDALIGPGAAVADGAVVARAVLGPRCRVGVGAEVVESVLLPDVVVGEGARVRRSIVGACASIGAGAVVEDLTVIGDGVAVDAGAVLAGARLPERV
jgi:mannose-1-phosphate guanylyltransferase